MILILKKSKNIRIHAIIEDQLAEFAMQELLQLVRMLDKVCQRWLRQMDEMHSNLWPRVAVQAHNSDKNGPTAVLKSVSKLRTNKITGGVLLNQKMTPQMLSTEENRQKLELLIKTFFNRLHGYHVQYNIVSKETLIDAQKHPEIIRI